MLPLRTKEPRMINESFIHTRFLSPFRKLRRRPWRMSASDGDSVQRCRPQGPPTDAGLKGVAEVRPQNGRIRSAELHWHEAHGSGRRKMKIKTFVD